MSSDFRPPMSAQEAVAQVLEFNASEHPAWKLTFAGKLELEQILKNLRSLNNKRELGS